MAPITKKQREDFRLQLITDNPRTDPYFVDLLLDVYDKNAGFVETLVKKHKQAPAPNKAYTPLVQKSIAVLADGEFEWPEQQANAKAIACEQLSAATENAIGSGTHQQCLEDDAAEHA